MPISFDMDTLRRALAAGAVTPMAIAEEVLARVAAADAAIWIARPDAERLRGQAAALEARAARHGLAALPLYGLPFAVKDNIDVAGLPTTAACPAFAYAPDRSAPVVKRLEAAGALSVGKTNLDQFATGLVGVRSPYGVPRNPFGADYIPGGSSSGSAVAVAVGLVSFALGTDTAGSGRVPAAFNNVVGLKPTRGLISTAGVVPACRSLDCVSIFALTVADACRVLEVARGGDPDDGYSRTAPSGFAAMGRLPARFAFGVPREAQLDFFGNDAAAALFAATRRRLESIGGEAVTIDLTPFLEAARLLYDGPWVAERTAALEAILRDHPDSMHPVTRRIVAGGERVSGIDAFRGHYRLAELRAQAEPVWQAIDCLLLPTAGTIYRLAEIEADPIALNSNLGRYTNFTNLMDLCALAVPGGFQPDGLPAGATLIAPTFHDPLVAAIGDALQRASGLPLGATGVACPAAAPAATATGFPYVPIAVVGAHLSGMPLNGELLALGARLRRAARTAPDYRLYALSDGKRPGLVRRTDGGAAIEVEVWDVPSAAVGGFLAGIAPPLGLGTIALADGSTVCGFLCEAHAATTARDITEFGGWRAYRQAAG